MTLGERIKKVRKEKDLTQQQFCNLIGFKQNSISLVESGKRNISDQAIKSICREFNVSEEWLRTGDGEMFVPKPESAIDKLVAEFKLGELEKQIILEFIGLEDKDRQGVIKYVQRLSQNKILQTAQEQPAPAMTVEQEADQFAALAREQFLAEKKQATQALSAKESDVG